MWGFPIFSRHYVSLNLLFSRSTDYEQKYQRQQTSPKHRQTESVVTECIYLSILILIRNCRESLFSCNKICVKAYNIKRWKWEIRWVFGCLALMYIFMFFVYSTALSVYQALGRVMKDDLEENYENISQDCWRPKWDSQRKHLNIRSNFTNAPNTSVNKYSNCYSFLFSKSFNTI